MTDWCFVAPVTLVCVGWSLIGSRVAAGRVSRVTAAAIALAWAGFVAGAAWRMSS